MGHSRQMRRKVKRAMMANSLNADTTNKMIDAYVDMPKHRQDMYNDAMGEMILLFAGYQRICEKRGKKKISEAVEKFVEFCNDMASNKTKRNEIVEMLRDETGYDFLQHADQLSLLVKEYVDTEESND